MVGAGYVALECAGFLTGLNHGKITVLVRSMPLRGFDRDVVDRVVSHLTSKGTVLMTNITPVSIVQLPTGKLQVTFSDGRSDDFDTGMSCLSTFIAIVRMCMAHI